MENFDSTKIQEYIDAQVQSRIELEIKPLVAAASDLSHLKMLLKKNEFHLNLINRALSDVMTPLSGRKTVSTKSIAILIPTKNRVDLLMSALKSCAWQTRSPDEVVIINDGNEFSQSQIQSIDDIFKGICNFVILPNHYPGGAAGGRKTGVEFSKCELFTYLDDDNLMWPTWLETIDREFRVDSDQLIYGAQLRKEWPGAILAEEDFSHKKLCEKNFIDTGAIAHHRNFGLWDTELKTLANDWDFALSIASGEKPSIRFVQEIASVYFTDANDRLSTFGTLNREGLREKYREYYDKNIQ